MRCFTPLWPRRGLSAKVGQLPNPGDQDGPWGDVGERNGQRAGLADGLGRRNGPKDRNYMLTRIRIGVSIELNLIRSWQTPSAFHPRRRLEDVVQSKLFRLGIRRVPNALCGFGEIVGRDRPCP